MRGSTENFKDIIFCLLLVESLHSHFRLPWIRALGLEERKAISCPSARFSSTSMLECPSRVISDMSEAQILASLSGGLLTPGIPQNKFGGKLIFFCPEPKNLCSGDFWGEINFCQSPEHKNWHKIVQRQLFLWSPEQIFILSWET